MKQGKLFIITASSGAGKSSIVTGVLSRLEETSCRLERVITYTTRAPRAGEQIDRDYHFIDEANFFDLQRQEFFLEWSKVYNHYYGSPRSIVDRIAQGFSYIMILDAHGVRALQQKKISACYIAITVPSIEELTKRLLLRGTETDFECQVRLSMVQNEYELVRSLMIDYHIINENLNISIDRLVSIIQKELQEELPHKNGTTSAKK